MTEPDCTTCAYLRGEYPAWWCAAIWDITQLDGAPKADPMCDGYEPKDDRRDDG